MITVVLLIGLIAAIAAATALALVVARRRPDSPDPAVGLLQQQLLAMNRAIESLSDRQQGLQHLLPKELAEGRAAQAEGLNKQLAALADVRERLGRLGEVTARLEDVGRSVIEVQQLLQVPKLRGTLGEVFLEEVLRQVLPAGNFAMQHRFASGEIVDAVIFVGPQCVPVDSKFPLEACARMLAAEGDAIARERAAFRRSLKARVTEISTKYIKPEQGTFDFALMYVPAENVYYEAVVRDEGGIDGDSFIGFAMAHRVIPVSPHTFYAYLAAVLYGLKGLRMEEQGREIRAQLGALDQSFRKFNGAFEKIGTHLVNAQKQYDEASRQSAKIGERFDAIAASPVAPPVNAGILDHGPAAEPSF